MVPCHGSPGSYSTIHFSTPGLGPPHDMPPATPRGVPYQPSTWLPSRQACPCTFYTRGQNDPPKIQPCPEACRLPQPCLSHFVLLEIQDTSRCSPMMWLQPAVLSTPPSCGQFHASSASGKRPALGVPWLLECTSSSEAATSSTKNDLYCKCSKARMSAQYHHVYPGIFRSKKN